MKTEVEYLSDTWPNYRQRMIVMANRAERWINNPIALFFALNEPMHARLTTALNAKDWLGVRDVRY